MERVVADAVVELEVDVDVDDGGVEVVPDGQDALGASICGSPEDV